eukprot:comp23350_c1_seq1/m.38557 comp23350_c1_seq1/g.38557  ORF comp23350_c1_seq1/g.38557 comp23350_c1_seq1/m.38557 type:complete len:939 (-) comp23350_c1_seq1:405-3221(-)
MRPFLGVPGAKPESTALPRSPVFWRRAIPFSLSSPNQFNLKKWTVALAVLVMMFVFSFHGSFTWVGETVQNKVAIVIENSPLHKVWGNYAQGEADEDLATPTEEPELKKEIDTAGVKESEETVDEDVESDLPETDTEEEETQVTDKEGESEGEAPREKEVGVQETVKEGENEKTVEDGAESGKETVKENGKELQPGKDGETQVDTATKPKYILFRAIGNDLPPRHALGQSYGNVKFILDNEPDLPGLERRWVVNRIVDEGEEARILALLRERNQTFVHIPLVLEEYAKRTMKYEGYGRMDMIHSWTFRELDYKMQVAVTDTMYHDKNLYVMNNNGARNVMIEEGIRAGARWILPFDGNCFLTRQAWDQIRATIEEKGAGTKYFTVPMDRLTNNSVLFDSTYKPAAKEEPQLIFRADAKERFNPKMRYGRRPKVELFWRLRIAGPWDRWPQSLGPWEKKEWVVSDDVPGPNAVPAAGWVARLFSGQGALEQTGALVDRGIMRASGVERLLTRLDVQVATQLHGFDPSPLLAYNESILAAERDIYRKGRSALLSGLIGQLLGLADQALHHGPFSVVNKTTLPPSGDKHDYYTPSPYYWPNPDTPDGLPYVRRDGERVPGTELYDAESERYDRSRLASMFGNTTCLALAWYFSDDVRYAERAALNIRTWFLDPATRMNPHMRYAQIRWGYNDNVGANYGIIETKDFYYLLDAVRLLHRAGALSDGEMGQLRQWFETFGEYVLTSRQGLDEYYRFNNHGLFYDVQMAAIAAFVGDIPRYLNHTERAKSRICTQFREDGTLPHEMERPTSLHYIMFTLQGWLTLGRMAEHAGVGLFAFTRHHPPTDDGSPPIMRGLRFGVPQVNGTWAHIQEGVEDMDRMLPLYYAGAVAYPSLVQAKAKPGYEVPTHLYAAKPLFFAHDGIQPFWNLGLVHPADLPTVSRQQ